MKTIWILLPFFTILTCICPQGALDPDSLLRNKSKMKDSVLFDTYKRIHSYYNSFAQDSAIYYGNLSLADAEKRGNKRFMVMMHMRICGNYIRIGDFASAQKHVTKALRIAEENQYEEVKPGIFNNMGVIFDAYGDYGKAIEYYNKAIDANKRLENWNGVGIAMGNLCGVLLKSNEPEDAKRNVEESLAIFTKSNDSMLQSTALNNLGEVYLFMNRYDSASYYLRKSLTLKEKLNLTIRIPVTLNLLGDLYLGQKKFDSVAGFYRRALRISDSLKLSIDGKAASKGLFEYFKATGDDRNALFFHEIYMTKNDSLYNLNRDRQIRELEIRYQVEKMNNEINTLHSRVLLQRRLRNLGILILLLSVALFLVSYKRIKLRSQLLEKENELEHERSKQLKFEVAEKNRELMSHSMLAIQKNQILNDLKAKLMTLLADPKAVEQALKLVEENHTIEKDWDHLKIHFEQVHPDFFTKLQNRYPVLTAIDLRHCAYIRIQMSSKDVARIMNVDPKSVKMTRYRLKKKFRLQEEDNLEVLLNEF